MVIFLQVGPLFNKKVMLVHHPEEVWMRCTYSDKEPWKKVKILKDMPGNFPLVRYFV